MQDTELGGHKIPKNSIIVVNTRNLHHHPDLWDRPEIFNPNRFLPEQRDSIPRLAYLPFGAGMRVCIGNHFAMMEGQLLLAQIASKFRIRLPREHRVRPHLAISLRPSPGLPMIIERRSKVSAQPSSSAMSQSEDIVN